MSTENKDKPNVIEDYNEYKHAVDTFVQLVKEYITKRGVRRWVMSLFSPCSTWSSTVHTF